MVTLSVKPIRPKTLASAKKVRLGLLNALRAEGRYQTRELYKTTQHWKHDEPTFKFEISLSGGDISLLVGPGGSTLGAQKWVWLDEGTRPHMIKPKKAKYLCFQTGFKSGSAPGSFKTSPSKHWGPYVRSKGVMHPGTKPRGWSTELYKERYKPYRERMNKAIKKALG